MMVVQLFQSLLAIVYCVQDLISSWDVTVKLKCSTQDLSSLEHKFHVLKKPQSGIGFLQPIFFSRESPYHALFLNNVVTPLCNILALQGGPLDLDFVLAVGYQLVSIQC